MRRMSRSAANMTAASIGSALECLSMSGDLRRILNLENSASFEEITDAVHLNKRKKEDALEMVRLTTERVVGHALDPYLQDPAGDHQPRIIGIAIETLDAFGHDDDDEESLDYKLESLVSLMNITECDVMSRWYIIHRRVMTVLHKTLESWCDIRSVLLGPVEDGKYRFEFEKNGPTRVVQIPENAEEQDIENLQKIISVKNYLSILHRNNPEIQSIGLSVKHDYARWDSSPS